MPEHTETSSHPLATAIKQEHQLDTTTTNLPPSSTTNNQPRPLPPSNDHCQDTKRKNSRRRPASTLTEAPGPHTGSSRTEQSVTSPSNMSSHVPSVHYTRTGRISKAKKGLKVHDCECGRSYTRAEHLRRHQKNHAQEGAMVCRFPECGKEFVRLDLLQRHEERHIELGDKSRQNSEPSSRASPTIAQHPLPPADVQVFPPTTLASPTYYQPMPVTSVPATPAAPSNKTSRGSVSNAPHVSMPIAVDHSMNSQFFDPWSQPPPLSPPSSYAPSPIPVQVEFPNQYPTYHSHYNDDACRTRSSSVVSHIEPWAATPKSPTSSQTTMPNLWYSEKAASGLAYMDPHYPVTSHGMMSSVDAMAGFGGHYGPKTMIQRDEEEAAYLFGAGEDPYGMGQLAHSFPLEQFLNNYWRLFDPAFPVVHRPFYETMSKSPMLHAAMIAIGGQYSNDVNAKRKSRDLHDRCMKLLEKRDHEAMAEDERLCDYQSVFLIEVLSQYRARRAAKTLSPRFGTLYHKACDNFRHRSLQASEILNLTHQDNVSQDSWTEWIDLMTWQHLLSACYVLESQQAILLAREPHSSIFRGSGVDLPLPAHPRLWAANTAREWTSAAREHPQTGQFLYDITNQVAPVHHTSFLSALLIATNYNHFGLSQPYMDMPPVADITHLLDPSRSTRYKLLTANLVRVTPIRALLAVSGESWILSEKVTSEETFSDLRFTLRTWLRHLWPSTPGTTSAPVKEALGLAIKILQLALSDSADACALDLGADMGVYFASLVLWGVVASATSRSTLQSSRRHSSDRNPTFAPPSPPSPPHNPAPNSLTHSQILATAKGFLKIAYALAATDPTAQSASALSQAQAGCVALLLWVKLRLRGGAAEGCVVGMGELCESVVGSLERVLAHGWKNWEI